METQISSNLQRCSEIADNLIDCVGSTDSLGLDIKGVCSEVTALSQELERLIEDLFVMTNTEDAREKYIDQKLKDASVDPGGLVERGLKKIMDQPTARDEMPETMEELADRPDASDHVLETIKNLHEVYRQAMIQGEKLYRIKNS